MIDSKDTVSLESCLAYFLSPLGSRTTKPDAPKGTGVPGLEENITDLSVVPVIFRNGV